MCIYTSVWISLLGLFTQVFSQTEETYSPNPTQTSNLSHSFTDSLSNIDSGSQYKPLTSDITGNNGARDVWILGLFPFNGSWAGGRGQHPAVMMGIEDVNKNQNILPGYRLRMTVDNTQCNAGIGTNVMYRRLYEEPTKLLVLGAGCSAVSQATAQASHLWNLVQLSYSSASPALSDKSKYRRFFRVFPPESSFNQAKLDLLQTYSWKKVGALYQEDEALFKLTTDDFITKARARDVEIVTSEGFVKSPKLQIANLKKHGVRIIIGNFYENKARLVFCEAYKQQMIGPKYVWIITGFYSPAWWRSWSNSDPHECTTAQLEEAIQGYFTADALPLSISGKPGISGKMYSQFIKEYQEITKQKDLTGHQEAPYGYDSVWAVANMLHNGLVTMRSRGMNGSLEDFTYNNSDMADIFLEEMNHTSFEGVSGPVMYDEMGDRQGLTQIEQLQGKKEVRVGVYNPTLETVNRILWENNTSVIWIDGDPPPDSITEKEVPELVALGLFITMTILASVGVVLSCLFLAFNIKYRHRKYIKMSSPNMNNIILTGAVLSYMSIIFCGLNNALVHPNNQLIMCKFYHWTLALSFSLSFGAMFSKTWRVHKIFTNKKIQRMIIKDYQLMAIVCALVGFDVLLLAVWEFLDPIEVVSYNKTHQQKPDPQNDNQILIPQARFCESQHMWYFTGILYAVKGLLLVFGAFLAYETRKVTVPALNDSKFIGLSVYNVVVLCLVGVPVSLMMKENINASFALISLFILFATTLTICLVFIPKIMHRNQEPHAGQMWNKTVDGTCHNNRQKTSAVCMFDEQEFKKIKDENSRLKMSLEQCRRRLHDLDTCNGGLLPSPMTISDQMGSVSEPNTPVVCRGLLAQGSIDDDFTLPTYTLTTRLHSSVSEENLHCQTSEQDGPL